MVEVLQAIEAGNIGRTEGDRVPIPRGVRNRREEGVGTQNTGVIDDKVALHSKSDVDRAIIRGVIQPGHVDVVSGGGRSPVALIGSTIC